MGALRPARQTVDAINRRMRIFTVFGVIFRALDLESRVQEIVSRVHCFRNLNETIRFPNILKCVFPNFGA